MNKDITQKYRTGADLKSISLSPETIDDTRYIGICYGLHKTSHEYMVELYLPEDTADTRRFLLNKDDIQKLYAKSLYIYNLFERIDGNIQYADYHTLFQNTVKDAMKDIGVRGTTKQSRAQDVVGHTAGFHTELYLDEDARLAINIRLHLQNDLDYNVHISATYIANRREIGILDTTLVMPDVKIAVGLAGDCIRKACAKEQLAKTKIRAFS